jgi:hypothetical protein
MVIVQKAKKIILVLIMFFLLILFQTPISFAQDNDSSSVESTSSFTQDNSTETVDPEPSEEEVATEETTTETNNNKDKESKEETPEVTEPDMSAMSMGSGGTSELAAGGVYSNPEAVTVSQTGSASFSYPIAVPPGRNGLQPNISLTYNSYSGNGWIGVGWELNLGSIKRSRRDGLDYTANDFMINDSDLVPNSSWGTNYYCEKIEGAFTRYYFNTGSNSWIATAKDGTKYYYGSSSSSRMTNSNDTYSWHLDKVEDTNGNYMTISYTTNNNQLYPYQISYTGNSGLSPDKTVEFGLEDRSDDIYSYKTKYLVTTAKRLKTITVKVNSSTAYKYIIYGSSPKRVGNF